MPPWEFQGTRKAHKWGCGRECLGASTSVSQREDLKGHLPGGITVLVTRLWEGSLTKTWAAISCSNWGDKMWLTVFPFQDSQTSEEPLAAWFPSRALEVLLLPSTSCVTLSTSRSMFLELLSENSKGAYFIQGLNKGWLSSLMVLNTGTTRGSHFQPLSRNNSPLIYFSCPL